MDERSIVFSYTQYLLMKFLIFHKNQYPSAFPFCSENIYVNKPHTG